ncbi:NHL repeat protein [Opisthorchis viverrini]|uniref:NHL repeat protein n=1 Tax=Opisthorchis viverrini TaxID=6198 RepID=A0A1S8X953_OPIVI|nr:NHL repeat protein [Opisthorchis viverrini]
MKRPDCEYSDSGYVSLWSHEIRQADVVDRGFHGDAKRLSREAASFQLFYGLLSLYYSQNFHCEPVTAHRVVMDELIGMLDPLGHVEFVCKTYVNLDRQDSCISLTRWPNGDFAVWFSERLVLVSHPNVLPAVSIFNPTTNDCFDLGHSSLRFKLRPNAENVNLPIMCLHNPRSSKPIRGTPDMAEVIGSFRIPRRISVVVPHPICPGYALSLFQMSFSTCPSLSFMFESHRDPLFVGVFTFAQLLGWNDSESVAFPTYYCSLQTVRFASLLYPGPKTPVLAFTVDRESRIYLLAPWRPVMSYGDFNEPEFRSAKDNCPDSEYAVLCLQIDESSTEMVDLHSIPTVLWWAPLCENFSRYDTRVDLMPRPDQTNVYWCQPDEPTHIIRVHLDTPHQLSSSKVIASYYEIPNPLGADELISFRCVERDTTDDLILAERSPDGGILIIMFRIPLRMCQRRDRSYPLYAFKIPTAQVARSPQTVASSSYGDFIYATDAEGYGAVFRLDSQEFQPLDNETVAVDFVPDGKHPQTDFEAATYWEIVSVLLANLAAFHQRQSIQTECEQTEFPPLMEQVPPLPITRIAVQTASLQHHWQVLSQKMDQVDIPMELRQLYRKISDTIGSWLDVEQLGSKSPSAGKKLPCVKNAHPSVWNCRPENIPINCAKLKLDRDQTEAKYAKIFKGIPRISTIYAEHFGGFGASVHDFREPNGLAILPEGVIAVADGNAEMIKFFSQTGRFLHCWKITTSGSSTAYPNCIAVRPREVTSPKSNVYTSTPLAQAYTHSKRAEYPATSLFQDSFDYPATESSVVETNETGLVVVLRKPSPSIQVYGLDGRKLREFAHDLLSPKCVTIDRDGRIIVVESHIMRVGLYTWTGMMQSRFQVDLDFPTAVAVDSNYRIYITDNLNHCVMLYNYLGENLGSIGICGLTNYPMGVAILACGTSSDVTPNQELVVIVDNHNRLNITVFRPNGELVYAMSGAVKHAQSYAIAVEYRQREISAKAKSTIKGSKLSVLLASKDCCVYRYVLPDVILR